MLTRAVTLTVRLLRLAPVRVRISVSSAIGRGLPLNCSILVTFRRVLCSMVRTCNFSLLESRSLLLLPNCTVRTVRSCMDEGSASSYLVPSLLSPIGMLLRLALSRKRVLATVLEFTRNFIQFTLDSL